MRLTAVPSGRAPFEQVVAEHGAVVMRVCRALLGPADADDAWSETFLSALRAYPRPAARQQRPRLAGDDRPPQGDRPAPRRGEPARRSPSVPCPTWRPRRSRRRRRDAELRAALDALAAEAAQARSSTATSPTCRTPRSAALLDSSEAAARRNAADGIASPRSPTGTDA